MGPTMKIVRIELFHVAVPLPAAFRPSWIPGFRQTENRFDLIRLETSDGLVGWSAAPRMGNERAGLGALLGPYLLGERADDIPTVLQRIREMSYLGWRVGWIEAACWDIIGKAAGKPVYELLGGQGGRVKLYASTGEVRSGAERVEEVQRRVDEGFDTIKLRVHDWTLEEDLAQIRATREGVGDAVALGVDANQGWRVAAIADAPLWDLERATAFCEVATELGFSWVEEPLANDDYAGLAELRRRVGVNISGGELNSQGPPEFDVMLEHGCLDWYQPDAVMTGGIAPTLAIAKAVQAAGFKYSPHTWTNGIGFAINLQVFAASGQQGAVLEYPLDPPGWVPEARDGLIAPWPHDRGHLDLPTGPGLGFEVDRSALARWGKRFYLGTPARVAISAVLDRGLSEARKLGDVRKARMNARSEALASQTPEAAAQAGLAAVGL